jgi:hypothetical protein
MLTGCIELMCYTLCRVLLNSKTLNCLIAVVACKECTGHITHQMYDRQPACPVFMNATICRLADARVCHPRI